MSRAVGAARDVTSVMDKRTTNLIAKVGAAILIAVLILSTLLIALQ
jgi:hypothetical protein